MNSSNYSIVYGFHVINELIHAKKRKIYSLFIEKNKKKNVNALLSQIPPYTKIYYVDKKKLFSLSGTDDHQSFVALVQPFVFQKKLPLSKEEKDIILFCNNIQDTKNVGALLRSAYCTNIRSVIITASETADITASACKASAGCVEYLTIYKAHHPQEDIKALQNNGYAIYLAAFGGEAVHSLLPIQEKKIVLVIGNEHEGISPSLLSYGKKISLSQVRKDVSYNASVAGGIMLYLLSTNIGLLE